MASRNEFDHTEAWPWLSAIMDATEVGYALIEGPVRTVVWRNAAFEQALVESGRSEEAFIECLLQAGCMAKKVDATGQSDGDLQLIELLPSDGKRPPLDRGVVDAVTGVLDRTTVLSVLREWCESHNERPFALVFLDLDDFKRINDEQGHLAGDRSLRRVGDRLKALVRAGDVVGRYGGDEFLMLLQGVIDDRVFQPVRQRLAHAFAVDPNGVAGPLVDASFGVAYSVECGDEPERLIETADRAMYAAKRAKLRAD